MNSDVTPHQAQNTRRLGRRLPLLITIAVVIPIILVVWILSRIGILPPLWAIILTTFFTITSGITSIIRFFTKNPPKPEILPDITIINNAPQLPFIKDLSFYQDSKTVEAIYEILQKEGTTALALSGISGIGKSTIAAQVYEYAEAQRSSGKDKRFNARPFWLCVDAAMTISSLVSSIMQSLDKFVPGLNSLPPQNQILSLINALDTLPKDESRLVFLDQFEQLLGKETFSQDNGGAGMLLDVLNRHIFSNPNCCVVFTARENMAEIDGYPLEHMQEYRLKGLNESESEEFLRVLKVEGSKAQDAIDTTKQPELKKVIGTYRGHPLSLALLASVLSSKNAPSVSELVTSHRYKQLMHGNPSEQLLEYIYHEQLDSMQRQLLLAFSLYREPVSVEAAHAASFPVTEASQAMLQKALQKLLSHHLLLRVEQELYTPHPLIAHFAHQQFDSERNLANDYTLVAAHARGARYYENQINSTDSITPELGRSSRMLLAFIEAAWHSCMATEWAKAYMLMENGKLFSRLPSSTRGATILLELYTLLFPLNKWQASRWQTAMINNELGEVYTMLEMHEKALPHFELALTLFREEHHIPGEVSSLCNLGRVHYTLGQEKLLWMNIEQEADVLRRAQDIPASTEYPITIYRYRKELSDIDYHLHQALQYLEQALQFQEGTRAYTNITGQIYHYLGQVYNLLRDRDQAIQYYEKALSLYKEIGPRLEEAKVLYSLGWFHNMPGSKQPGKAIDLLNQALFIQREIEDRRGEVATLDKLGRVYDDMTKAFDAERYYRQALHVEREIGDFMGAAITLHNMGLLYFKEGTPTEEMVAFLHHAQRIFEEVHYPTPERVQRQLHGTSSKHEKEAFADLWRNVAPRTAEIISQTLSRPPLLDETPRPAALSFTLPGQHTLPKDKTLPS